MSYITTHHTHGATGPIILWPMYPHRGNEIEHTIECIESLCPDADYTLIAIQVNNWNQDLSPWSHPSIDQTFTGGGADTRDWITKKLIPDIKEKYGFDRPMILMGYSLAGLFALWALCQDDAFAGAICCSGSTWYPDFVDFIRANLPTNRYIYLSLGGKEANTKDPLMATVADRTKEVLQILKKDNVVIFEENAGGHFADSGKRLAKGVRWMIAKSHLS